MKKFLAVVFALLLSASVVQAEVELQGGDDSSGFSQAQDKASLAQQKINAGWERYNQEDFDAALKLFNEAINLAPDNATAWLNRGTTYLELKQYDRAIKDLNKAIALNPNHTTYNN